MKQSSTGTLHGYAESVPITYQLGRHAADVALTTVFVLGNAP
jgi:hypothetical protein